MFRKMPSKYAILSTVLSKILALVYFFVTCAGIQVAFFAAAELISVVNPPRRGFPAIVLDRTFLCFLFFFTAWEIGHDDKYSMTDDE